MAVAAGHVVDEVAERLRDRRAGVRGQEGVQVGGGPPGVERAAYGAGGEAVDGRPALGLDVREHREHLGERALQRAGGDGGQVGLEEHVVEGFGEERGESGRRRRGGGVSAGWGPPVGSGRGGCPGPRDAGALRPSVDRLSRRRRAQQRASVGRERAAAGDAEHLGLA